MILEYIQDEQNRLTVIKMVFVIRIFNHPVYSQLAIIKISTRDSTLS